MAIRLLNAHVLVRPDAPEHTINGVMIPDFLQRKSVNGTVVSVGQYYFSNGTKMDFDLEPGDRVNYRPHDGDLIPVDGEELLLLGMAQLIGVMNDDDE